MPTTVAFLLGAHDPAALVRALGDADVAGAALAGTSRLPANAHRVLDERVGGVLHKLLDIDLAGLVVDGWAERGELADAVLRTRSGRPPEEVLLSDHRITSTHHPTVDVLAGGTAVTALRFDLVVTLRLRAVAVAVHGGLLVAVERGQLLAEATLSLDGRQLLTGNGRGPVGSIFRLGDGLLVPGPGPAYPDGEVRPSSVLHLPRTRRDEPAPPS